MLARRVVHVHHTPPQALQLLLHRRHRRDALNAQSYLCAISHPLPPSIRGSVEAFQAPASRVASVKRADVSMFYGGPVTGNFFERAGLPIPGAGAAPKPKKVVKKVVKKVSPAPRALLMLALHG